jgi:hypothetical protein
MLKLLCGMLHSIAVSLRQVMDAHCVKGSIARRYE